MLIYWILQFSRLFVISLYKNKTIANITIPILYYIACNVAGLIFGSHLYEIEIETM